MGDISTVWHRSLHWNPQQVVSASGSYVTLDNGQTLIDAVGGGAAVTSVGHAHPKVLAAMQAYLTSGAPMFFHTAFFTTGAAEELAHFLLGDKDGGLAKAYFLSSGSEASTNAYYVFDEQDVISDDACKMMVQSRWPDSTI